MVEYLMTMKNTVDALVAAATIIPNDDLINYVLDGLQSSYKSFLIALSLSPIIFEELHALLLTM